MKEFATLTLQNIVAIRNADVNISYLLIAPNILSDNLLPLTE